MGETVQTYSVDVNLEESLTKIRNFQTVMKKFNTSQEASLRRQIALTKSLSKVSRVSPGTGVPSTGKTSSPFPGKQTTNLPEVTEIEKLERKRVQSLERARVAVRRSALMLDKAQTSSHAIAQAAIRERVAKARTSDEVKLIVAQEKSRLRMALKNTNELKRQNFLMGRLSASSRQFAGGMVNAFAVIGGLGMVAQIGQDFESVENTMLAVSGSSEKAAENFKFVRNEAFRLGASLRSTSKDYAKLLASANNQLSGKQTEDLLTGVLEASTALGVSADDTSGALRAIQQMLGKTKIMSEELRGQLAERLPGSVEIMAKAAQEAGIIGKEVPQGQLVSSMNKLMEQGKLLSKDVLPFFSKGLSKLAAPSIEKAMKSNRVAMNRFVFSLQEAANEMFKGGFSQGLTNLFNKFAQFIRDNTQMWTTLGRVIGTVFEGMGHLIEGVGPTLEAMGSTLSMIVDGWSEIGKVIKSVNDSIDAAGDSGLLHWLKRAKDTFEVIISPLQTVLALLEELAIFTGDSEKVSAFKVSTVGELVNKSNQPTGDASTNKTSIEVTVPLVVDGEVLAESIANTSAVESVIDSRMFHHIK